MRKHPLANCPECPLAKKDCAPTAGPADAKVALVSRSPGFHDAQAGRPFAGPSGQVLDHLLGLYNVQRSDILTTNVVLCETDSPPLKAIECCKPRLEAEIASADTIIAAGAEAARLLSGFGSIDAQRGFVKDRVSNTNGRIKLQRVIVTNNPAVVLRESDTFPNLVNDFKLALDPPSTPKDPTVTIVD